MAVLVSPCIKVHFPTHLVRGVYYNVLNFLDCDIQNFISTSLMFCKAAHSSFNNLDLLYNSRNKLFVYPTVTKMENKTTHFPLKQFQVSSLT